MKWLLSTILTFVALVAFTAPAEAQYTVVSGTVVDANAIPYVAGNYNVTFVNTTGQPASFLGSPLTQTAFSGKLSTAGSFSIQLPSNSGSQSITPAGTQWNFSFTASDGGSGFSLAVTVTGSTQSISTAIAAASPVLTFAIAEPNGRPIPVGPNAGCPESNGTLMYWLTCGGGGANTSLSNLSSPTAINRSLIPNATGLDIGQSGATSWNNGWFLGNVMVGGNLIFTSSNGTVQFYGSAILFACFPGVVPTPPTGYGGFGCVDSNGLVDMWNTSALDFQPMMSGYKTSCTMSSGTTCSVTIANSFTTPGCIAMLQGTGTVIAAECSLSGTTALVTAASSNSATWAIVAFGMPN